MQEGSQCGCPFYFGMPQKCGAVRRYNDPMATSPKIPKSMQPRDPDAVGPQNAAERRLYDLIMEGVNSGPAKETSIEELAASLRQRIRTKR